MCKLGETDGSISWRLTLPKLHLATLKLRRNKGKQIILKTVRASKLTWQRTPQIKNAHLDCSPALLTAFARSDKKNFFIHGELTEANKALCFFSERGVI